MRFILVLLLARVAQAHLEDDVLLLQTLSGDVIDELAYGADDESERESLVGFVGDAEGNQAAVKTSLADSLDAQTANEASLADTLDQLIMRRFERLVTASEAKVSSVPVDEPSKASQGKKAHVDREMMMRFAQKHRDLRKLLRELEAMRNDTVKLDGLRREGAEAAEGLGGSVARLRDVLGKVGVDADVGVFEIVDAVLVNKDTILRAVGLGASAAAFATESLERVMRNSNTDSQASIDALNAGLATADEGLNALSQIELDEAALLAQFQNNLTEDEKQEWIDRVYQQLIEDPLEEGDVKEEPPAPERQESSVWPLQDLAALTRRIAASAEELQILKAEIRDGRQELANLGLGDAEDTRALRLQRRQGQDVKGAAAKELMDSLSEAVPVFARSGGAAKLFISRQKRREDKLKKLFRQIWGHQRQEVAVAEAKNHRMLLETDASFDNSSIGHQEVLTGIVDLNASVVPPEVQKDVEKVRKGLKSRLVKLKAMKKDIRELQGRLRGMFKEDELKDVSFMIASTTDKLSALARDSFSALRSALASADEFLVAGRDIQNVLGQTVKHREDGRSELRTAMRKVQEARDEGYQVAIGHGRGSTLEFLSKEAAEHETLSKHLAKELAARKSEFAELHERLQKEITDVIGPGARTRALDFVHDRSGEAEQRFRMALLLLRQVRLSKESSTLRTDSSQEEDDGMEGALLDLRDRASELERDVRRAKVTKKAVEHRLVGAMGPSAPMRVSVRVPGKSSPK